MTAWGERFELFPECDPLTAGRESVAHTHVTLLADFSPMTSGKVTGILRDAAGDEQRFVADRPLRDGIFAVPFTPARAGEFDLSFLIETGGAVEEVASGRVLVGEGRHPGTLIEEPASASTRPGDGTPVTFLKEQQWKTEFATAWVAEGSIHRRVSGPGMVIPPAGGEIVVTAPVDGVIDSDDWPYPGHETAAGRDLFSIIPVVSSGRSLERIEAEVSRLRTELNVASARSDRLAELIRLEAVSRRELEEADSRVETLGAELEAARKDLQAAQALRRGGRGAGGIGIPSPINGRVASVAVSPGQFVAAGDPLLRVVKVRPLWLEVALSPADAGLLRVSPAGVQVWGGAEEPPAVFEAPRVRLIVVAPEVDSRTGLVNAILEIDTATDELRLGRRVNVDLLLADERQGTVIPVSALVDDSGVSVVFTQSSGEEFLRRPVTVLGREGARLLVEGLRPGERLVVRGGNTIRRASMLSGGAPAGHVH